MRLVAVGKHLVSLGRWINSVSGWSTFSSLKVIILKYDLMHKHSSILGFKTLENSTISNVLCELNKTHLQDSYQLSI